MTDLIIRKAVPEDAEGRRTVSRLTWAQAYAHFFTPDERRQEFIGSLVAWLVVRNTRSGAAADAYR